MYYEAALVAPAVAAYLARTDDRRPLAVTVTGLVCLCALPHYSIFAILAALVLLALRSVPARAEKAMVPG
jgi:phosphatidylserine synthase